MRNSAKIVLGLGAAVLLGGLAHSPASLAAGKAPSSEVCGDKANPPKDEVTKGGCVVIDRRKGNCMACHVIEGTSLGGNVAPPLVAMKQRFPDKSQLRAKVWDMTKFNPHTSMPPFGKHRILTEEEVDQVVEFLLTL